MPVIPQSRYFPNLPSSSLGRDPLYSLLLTFGLAYMIEDGTRFVWGAQSCRSRSRIGW